MGRNARQGTQSSQWRTDSPPRPAAVPVPQRLLELAHPFVVAGTRQGRGRGGDLAHAAATAPSRHRPGAARGPALPKETAPTCTAGKQGARPPEEGGAEAGRRGGGARCRAGAGRRLRSRPGGEPWWYRLQRDQKPRELSHLLSAAAGFLIPAPAIESLPTVLIRCGFLLPTPFLLRICRDTQWQGCFATST